MSAETILVTGGSGFLGSALAKQLATDDCHALVLPARNINAHFPSSARVLKIDGLDGNTDWRQALAGVDKVVHAAARVHVMKEISVDPLAEFRRVNVEGTLNLARQALTAGVKRFIFISSIKVNGERTMAGTAFSADDVPAPVDPYGLTKLEAEEGLRALLADSSMELVIIRPVLIYGPGVKANFQSMMSWVAKGLPLPFGAINNRRSLVALDNMIDLIITCLKHPAAANQTFLVSDGQDVSTTDLLHKTGDALGRPARLVPVPAGLMRFAATCLGKQALAQRLFDSLQVDIGKNKQLLGWTPPVTLEHALIKTAHYLLENTKS